MLKKCPSCKQIAEFYDTFTCAYCITCWRAYSARYRENHRQTTRESKRRTWNKNKDKYNLNRKLGGVSTYKNLLEKQNNVCAICENEETSRRYKTLSVDHCHNTGKIRGLLCSNCNRALGLFRDNIKILEKAVVYLNEH